MSMGRKRDKTELERKAEQMMARVRSRIVPTCKATVWIAFDTMAEQDAQKRDEWLEAFRLYCDATGERRTVGNALLWLAEQEDCP